MTEYIKVAQITSPHGIKGQVKIYLYTDSQRITEYQYFYLGPDYIETSIKLGSVKKNQIIATIDHIKDIDQAQQYRNTNIYIKREDLPEIKDEHTYYIADLIGLSVIDKNSTKIGNIKDIVDYGAGDIVTIKLNNSDIVYYPFNHIIFPDINFDKKEIYFIEPEIC